MGEYESLEVKKAELERMHKIAMDMLINFEVEKENEEKEEELGGFDLQEDIGMQMDFFEIMRSENNVR